MPSREDVEAADHARLAWWMRFLVVRNPEDVVIINLITERFKALGGWNAALSKHIGWEG